MTSQTEIKIVTDRVVTVIETEAEREVTERVATTIVIEMTANERETGTTIVKRWIAARGTERGERETAIEVGGEGMKIEERGVVPVVEEGREGKEVGGLEGVAEDTVSSSIHNILPKVSACGYCERNLMIFLYVNR